MIDRSRAGAFSFQETYTLLVYTGNCYHTLRMASSNKNRQAEQPLIEYIEGRDADLATAIRDANLDGKLTSDVTFLFPEAAQLAAIKAASIDTLTELLSSHVVPFRIGRAEDFKSAGNLCGAKFVCKACSGDSCTMEGFSVRKCAGHPGVWDITQGAPPCKNDGYNPPSRMKSGGGDKKSTLVRSTPRAMLAARVEECFADCMGRGAIRTHNPYLLSALGLLNHLKAFEPALLAKAQEIIDYNPTVTFYLLVEPYKTRGEHIIPDAVIAAWGGSELHTTDNPVAEFKAFFEGRGDTAAVDAVRRTIKTDYVGGITNAYKNDMARLWRDEFRFGIHSAMMNNMTNVAEFTALVEHIRDCWPGNAPADEVLLCNKNRLKSNCAPRAELKLICAFIESTDFLYSPIAPTLVGSWGTKRLTDKDVYNRNASALAYLDLFASMRTPVGLSSQARAEVEFLRKSGITV
jgi:hypothetical protein